MIDIALPISALACVISVVALVRSDPAKTPAALTAAMCPCGHGINFHDKLSGACNATLRWEPIEWSDVYRKHPIDWEAFDCECLVYAGPELMRGVTGQNLIAYPEVDNGG